MPASARSGRDEYLAAHIPGARFFDIDEVSDHSNPAPHMLPAAGEFGAAMERLGIGRDDRIVIYDNSPIHTAARGWFTFRHFGARQVAILDGGMQKWVAEGRPTEAGEPQPRAARFDAVESADVVTKQQILGGLDCAILDARGKGRFEATEPEPRAGIAGGHIPGARNLPFGQLYRTDGTFKSPDELRALFAEAGIDPAQPFAASCGSGVTAAALVFAAHLIGNDGGKVYDGSWSEWGADSGNPEGNWPGLGEDDPGDVLKVAADLVDHRPGGLLVRLAPFLALDQQGFESCRGSTDHGARAALEVPLLRRPGCLPCASDGVVVVIEVRCRAPTERLDQPKRVADARKAGHRLGISQRLGVSGRMCSTFGLRDRVRKGESVMLNFFQHNRARWTDGP